MYIYIRTFMHVSIPLSCSHTSQINNSRLLSQHLFYYFNYIYPCFKPQRPILPAFISHCFFCRCGSVPRSIRALISTVALS